MKHDLRKLRERLVAELRSLGVELLSLKDYADVAELDQAALVLRDAIDGVRRARQLIGAAKERRAASSMPAPSSDSPGTVDTPATIVAQSAAAVPTPQAAAAPVLAPPLEYQMIHREHFFGE